MSKNEPRSNGSLSIGKLHYDEDLKIFRADMIFETNLSSITEDCAKSAALAVHRHTMTLLHQNGLWHHEAAPQVRMLPLTPRTMLFKIEIKAQATGEKIKVRETNKDA